MRKSKNKVKSLILILIFIIIGGISLHLIFNGFVKKTPENLFIISPLSKLSIFSSRSDNTLKAVIENEIKETNATFGIAIKNLKTGESYYLNEHRNFETGSLYKLWVMATIYKKIDEGSIRNEDILEEEVSILNEKFKIATESAEKTEGKIKMSVSDALEQMISVSDNYSALLLTAKIRLANVSAFLKNNGFNESKVGIKGESPTTSAWDIALFYEKLYKGELANKLGTQEMLELLKRQRLNNKLPKYLPKNTDIAHKTGELDPFTHDAGIVYASNRDYIIVVLSESDNRFATEEIIAKLSKLVLDYFERKK